MYAIDLICSNGHKFESWFRNRSSFEELRDNDLVSCPHCNDTNVEQAISPVRIGKHKSADERTSKEAEKKETLKAIDHIKRTFEDVGTNFSEEAIKMHFGETERRNIRGTATSEEEKELTEEGVPFFKIPEIQ